MATRRTIRIFVSSPGDVGQERVLAARVLARLQGDFAGYADIEPILWEHEPLRATAHFQKQIVTPSSTDIVVCILWSRLGTRLPSDQFVRPDGSTYASGTEWEFEDAALAYLEKGTPDLLVYRRSTPPPLSFKDESALDRVEQKRALDAFIDRWFGNPQDGFRAAFTTFESPDEFEEILERHLGKLIKERLPERLAADEGDVPITWYRGSPYRGLQAFDYEHAAVFFGRTRAIGAVREALVHQAAQGKAFVLVFGMSGGGKSSLVRAGVLPTITQPGVVDGVGLWRWCTFRPSDAAAGDLFDGFATALTAGETALPELLSEGEDAAVASAALADLMRRDPGAAAGRVRDGLARAAEAVAREERLPRPPETRLALVVDQMEELFTREQIDAKAREALVALLSALARSGAVWVIGTMRSDFYPRCGEIPELVALKEGMGSYDLQPPTSAEIGQMIRFPTRAAGLRFEKSPERGESLDDLLLDAASRDPGALPLLEFTLDELFRQRDEAHRMLTFDAYRALGGLEGALARRAEEVYAGLPPAAQNALPSVLRALITVSEEDERIVTSRRVSLDAVAGTPERRQLVDAFVAARLLVTDRADSGEAVVRVAHEALLNHWPRLTAWLDEDRDFLRVRARVADAASRWHQEGRRPDFLLPTGKPLTEALDLLSRRRADLEPGVAEFVERSEQRATHAERTRRRTLTAVAAAFLLLVTVFGAFNFAAAQRAEREAARARSEAAVAQQQTRRAQEQERIAREQRTFAQKQHAIAQRERAVAQRESRAARRQKEVAEQQRALARRQQTAAEEQRRIAEAERRVAQAQRAVALRNYGHAVVAADTMVGELAEGIKPIAGTQSKTVRRILASASDVYDRLLAGGETPEALLGKARMLGSSVDIYLRLNDTTRAVESARGAVAILTRLAKKDPKNERYRAELARGHDLLGRALERQGRVAPARAAWERALPLWEALATGRGANEEHRAGLASSRANLADALYLQDDRARATKLYDAAYRARRDLAARQPGDARHWRALGVSEIARGDVYRDGGDADLDRSARAYEAALAAFDRATRVSGGDGADDSDLQKKVADAHYGLGMVHLRRNDAARAAEHLRRAAETADRFVRLDPHNAEWLSALVNARMQQSDIAGGTDPRKEMRDQVAIIAPLLPRMERLAREDPANARNALRLLALHMYRAAAFTRLAQLGDAPKESLAAAEESCRRQEALARQVAAADDTCFTWAITPAAAAFARGKLLVAQGRPDEARAWDIRAMQTSVAAHDRIADRFPREPARRHRAAAQREMLAGLFRIQAETNPGAGARWRRQNLENAARHFRAALADYSDASGRAPGNRAWRADRAKCRSLLAGCHILLAETGVARGENLARAEAHLRRAVQEYEALVREEPANPAFLEGLSPVYTSLAGALLAQKKNAEMETAFRQGQAVQERLARLTSGTRLASASGSTASRLDAASRGTESGQLLAVLRRKLVPAGSLYLSDPTTPRYREVVDTCLEMAELLLLTPDPKNRQEARETLALGYQLHDEAKKNKTLPAETIAEQERLRRSLEEAFDKIPKDAPPSGPPATTAGSATP